MSLVTALRKTGELSPRQAGTITGLVLGGGGICTFLYSSTGAQCPFRAMGLACPGCGCGRAAMTLFSKGVGAALRAQPTATALVLTLCAVTVLSMLPLSRPRKWQSGHLLYIPLFISGINLAWQLAIGRAF